jgi:hypothetical protein
MNPLETHLALYLMVPSGFIFSFENPLGGHELPS